MNLPWLLAVGDKEQARKEAMRDGQFTTTYLRDIMRLWCNRCEKSVVVKTGQVDDELLDRHRCGPPGAGWDSDQDANSFIDDENHAEVE